MKTSVLVIGLGNELRGDDAAGLEVVRRLRGRELPPGLQVQAHGGEAVALLDVWADVRAALLVDTMRGGGGPPGTIHRFDLSPSSRRRAPHVPLPSTSTHAIGLEQAIELGRALRRLPRTLVVYGVEGSSFDPGTALSEGVADAIEPLADALMREAERLAAR
jgi:hydrogenase maturation protease